MRWTERSNAGLATSAASSADPAAPGCVSAAPAAPARPTVARTRRPASSGDVQSWLTQFHSGMTDEHFQSILLGSGEYFSTRAGNNNTQWLNAVYQDVFGRPADPAALATYLPQLSSGTSRESIAFQLLGSNEYRQKLVTNYYTLYLSRVPSQAEVDNFVRALQQGTTDEAVISTLIASVAPSERNSSVGSTPVDTTGRNPAGSP